MDLITRLKVERDGRVHGGIYDITQKHFAYNSNKIEGSRLTEEQTSFIYETKTIATLIEQSHELEFNEVMHKAGAYYGIEVIADGDKATTVYVSERIWEAA